MERRGHHLGRQEFLVGAARLGLVAERGRMPWEAHEATMIDRTGI